MDAGAAFIGSEGPRMFPGLRRFCTRGRFMPFLVALAFVAAWGTASADSLWLAKNVPMRIMALGDSITAGVGERGIDTGSGGYRAELQRQLDANGYRYTMVGERSDFSARLVRRHHEGWPGYVIRSFSSDSAPQLYGRVTHAALKANDPDVVLLMAGTNDLLRLARRSSGYTIPNIVQSMNALLAQIFYEKPNVDVIVAGVVASPLVHECDVERFDGTGTCGLDGGPNLRRLVADYAARGFHIALAQNMSDAVPRDKAHFPDGIHPSGLDGYDAVARVWVHAIQELTAVGERTTIAGR